MNTAASTARGPETIRRGDVFWLESEEATDDGPGFRHPHVVIQEDLINRSRVHTVIVCALTSNLNRANEPGNVLLDVGEGNLPRRSVIVVSQVSSVEKARLGEHIGTLSHDRIDQVLDGLRFQQTSFFGER